METSLWNGNFLVPPPRLTPKEEFITRLYEILYQKACDSCYSVPKLCRDIGMSSSQLHRKLIALTGQPAIALIIAVRLEKAKQLLETRRQQSITDIAFDCGFDDPDYFSRTFSRRFGVPPSKFRKAEG